MPLSIITYDSLNGYSLRERKMHVARGHSSLFFKRFRRFQEEFRRMQAVLDECEGSLGRSREGEERERLEREVDELKGEVLSRIREMEVIEEVYDYVVKCYEEGAGKDEWKTLFYIEVVEGYVKRESERENGDFEALLITLYRVMRESRCGEEAAFYNTNKLRTETVSNWLRGFSRKIPQVECQVDALEGRVARQRLR